MTTVTGTSTRPLSEAKASDSYVAVAQDSVSLDSYNQAANFKNNVDVMQAGVVGQDSDETVITEISFQEYDDIIQQYAKEATSTKIDDSLQGEDIYFAVLPNLDYETALTLSNEVDAYIAENSWNNWSSSNERAIAGILHNLVEYSDFNHEDGVFKAKLISFESNLSQLYARSRQLDLSEYGVTDPNKLPQHVRQQLSLNQLVTLFEPYRSSNVDAAALRLFWENLKSEIRLAVYIDYEDTAITEMVHDSDVALKADLKRDYPALDRTTIKLLTQLRDDLMLQVQKESDPIIRGRLLKCLGYYFGSLTNLYNLNDPVQFRWHSRFNPNPQNGRPLTEYRDVFSIKTLYALIQKQTQYDSEDINRDLFAIEDTLASAAYFLSQSSPEDQFEDLVLNLHNDQAIRIVLACFYELGEMALSLYDKFIFYQQQMNRDEMLNRLDYFQHRLKQRLFEIPAENALADFVTIRPVSYRQQGYINIFDNAAPKDLLISKDEKKAIALNLNALRKALALLIKNDVGLLSEGSKKYVEEIKRQLVFAILLTEDLNASDLDLIDAPNNLSELSVWVNSELNWLQVNSVASGVFVHNIKRFIFAHESPEISGVGDQVLLMPEIMDNNLAHTWLDNFFWTSAEQINSALYFVLLTRAFSSYLAKEGDDNVSNEEKKMLTALVKYFEELVPKLKRDSQQMRR